MNTHPGFGLAPLAHLLVGLGQAHRPTAPHEPALHIAYTTFHLAFVFGCGRAAGQDQKSIVLRTLPVCHLYYWIIPNCLGDPTFEVVNYQPLRHSAKEFQGIPVAAQPGFRFLVENKLHIRIPAPPQHHHKCPGFAQITFCVQHHPHIAKVNLRFFSRLAFLARKCLHWLWRNLARQSQH